MDKIEKIRQEIERLKGAVTTTIKGLRMPEPSERMCGELDAYDDVLWFLDTLSEEPDRPEPYTGKYDEAYLNEKIKKASEHWRRVDVDKMLAECRRYDEEHDKSLEEAAGSYLDNHKPLTRYNWGDLQDAFIAGAEWQYQKDRGEFAKIKAKTWCEGYDAHKQKMLKDAVEGYVNYYEDSGGKLMAEAQVGCPYHMGDKVKIIIVKEDKK